MTSDPTKTKDIPVAWEAVADCLQRIKVPGGWLYKSTTSDWMTSGEHQTVVSESMQFVPDQQLADVLQYAADNLDNVLHNFAQRMS